MAMTKREIPSSRNTGTFPPIVLISEKKGTTFTGEYVGETPNPVYKNSKNHLFKIKDTTARVTKKEDKEIVEVDVEEGDEVSLFGSSQLDDKLSKVNKGDLIEIVFNGKQKNPGTGRTFHEYIVSVIE